MPLLPAALFVYVPTYKRRPLPVCARTRPKALARSGVIAAVVRKARRFIWSPDAGMLAERLRAGKRGATRVSSRPSNQGRAHVPCATGRRNIGDARPGPSALELPADENSR